MGLGISDVARRCISCDERNDRPGPLCSSCSEHERDACATCGQQIIGERDAAGTFRCHACLETAAHRAGGTQERLFTPAPNQMPGQTMLGAWDALA